MAANAAIAYGTDIACMRDADSLFTGTVGLPVVRQDAFHRLTTDDILGDDGTGSILITGWGFDSRRLLGINASKLAAYQPILADVLQRDLRVLSADVVIKATKTANGTADLSIVATCATAEGPFDLIVPSVQALTALGSQQ